MPLSFTISARTRRQRDRKPRTIFIDGCDTVAITDARSHMSDGFGNAVGPFSRCFSP
jgi:hypothetical protein